MKNEFKKFRKHQVKKHFNCPLLPKLISLHNFKRALNPENLFLLSQTAATKKYCKNKARISSDLYGEVAQRSFLVESK